MNKNVAIILSTFNGEKYIDEQMKSLVNQTYKDIEIFIHDDGSKDSTVEVLKSYVVRYSNIHLIEGKTGDGYPACFINLLKKVEGFSYYAFSDQDDVWKPTKIENAVNHLSLQDSEIPILYYTAVEYCDASLNFIRSSRFAEGKKQIERLSLQTLLFGGEAMGMTYVFNGLAREALINTDEKCTFKDWFLKVYCATCGNVYFNPNPSALYRRHEKAVTNATNPSPKLGRYLGQFKEIFINTNGFENQKKIIRYINDNFRVNILAENRELFELFSEPNCLKNRFKKVFWYKRYRTKWLDEIGYRCAFLMGRM